MGPKQKQYPAVDVSGDRSKVWCCKEQYCIGTWNGRSMNQGKLDVVKQEMARVNVDILGIRVRNAVLGCNLKNDRMISVRFQGKPFNITVTQVYAPTSNAEEAEVEQFYEDL